MNASCGSGSASSNVALGTGAGAGAAAGAAAGTAATFVEVDPLLLLPFLARPLLLLPLSLLPPLGAAAAAGAALVVRLPGRRLGRCGVPFGGCGARGMVNQTI